MARNAPTPRPPDDNGMWPARNDSPRLHFNPEDNDSEIEHYGVGCQLRKSVLCPCIRVETRAPRAGCPHCGGNGYLWPEDMTTDIIAMVLNRRPTGNEEAAGVVVVGQVQVSFLSGYVPGEGDMLLPAGELHVVHQELFRELLQVDSKAAWDRTTNPTGKPPKLKPMIDRLLYPDAIIERVAWLEGGDDIKTSRVATGLEGIDFRISNGRVEWFEGRGPETGRAYSMRYTAPAAYILLPGNPKLRSDGSDVLPYQATGTRLDRWGYPDLRDM